MDPLSLTRSAISLASSCKQLYLFFRKVRDGDPVVNGFWKEIEGLDRTVRHVRSIAETILLDKGSFLNCEALFSVLQDCEETVRDVYVRLGSPDSGQRKEILQKVWRQFKLSFKEDDIEALQTQLAWNRDALVVSLQSLSLYAHSLLTFLKLTEGLPRGTIHRSAGFCPTIA
jgi:hypothetical protein